MKILAFLILIAVFNTKIAAVTTGITKGGGG